MGDFTMDFTDSNFDKEVIKSANDAGITMVLSGTRHFKH